LGMCVSHGGIFISAVYAPVYAAQKVAGLTEVNSMADFCQGDFTRLQDACVNGVNITLKTTIDYVLVPVEEDRTVSLTIDADSSLDSDHRPLLMDTCWRPGPRPGNQCRTPLSESWCVADASEKDWENFAVECDMRMSNLLQGDGAVEWPTWLEQMRLAAKASTKKVGAGSKKWFDKEIRELHSSKVVQVATVGMASPSDRELAVAKLEGLKKKLRNLIKSIKKSARYSGLRKLENLEGSGKEYWRLWNATRKDFLGRRATPMRWCDRTVGWCRTDPVEDVARVRSDPWKGTPIRLDDTGGTGAPGTDTDFDAVFAQRVLQQMAEFSLVDGGIPELDAEVSLEEVQKEIRRLEGGKAAGLDGIVPEMLKKAGRATEEALVSVLNLSLAV
jgi:hypothetical protein